MVLSDGPIKKIEDLKDKVVATVAAGAAVDIAIRAMLRRHGLEDKRDYVMVEAPLPAMRAMLADKKADLIPVGCRLRLTRRCGVWRIRYSLTATLAA